MKKPGTGIRVYSVLLIAYGIYILLGLGDHGQFSLMFKGLPGFLVSVLYGFNLLYGISCVYCGLRIRKLENWARLLIMGLTCVSIISGLALNQLVMMNFREFLVSESSGIPAGMTSAVYNTAVVMTGFFTLFEISIIFFLTRPKVAEQFKS